MRINNIKLNDTKTSIEEHLEKYKLYQKEYYYVSEELFLNWRSLKANFYKDLLIKEKNNNEKICYKIDSFLLIIDEIIKKYDQYDSIGFEKDFSDVLIDNINKVINKYVGINYKYNLIASNNNTTVETVNKNTVFMNKSIELYDNLKAKVKELDISIKEKEKSIRSKLSDYTVDVNDRAPRALKYKGDEDSITFDSNKIALTKSKLEGKYKLLSDEIENLIENLDSIISYYNTSNVLLLTEKINLLKVNLKIARSNFINNINLLDDELDAKAQLQTKMSVDMKGFELYE